MTQGPGDGGRGGWASTTMAAAAAVTTAAPGLAGTPWRQNPLADLVREHFPPIAYGFAYGSGVFVQPELYPDGSHSSGNLSSPSSSSSSSSSTKPAGTDGPMVDFIFVVDDPEDWHAQNLEANASHYSGVRFFGAHAVARAADTVGAGVWFNTLVPLAGRLIKYGVIGRHAFLEDVATWRHLYVPGRLHKPVLPLIELPWRRHPAAATAAALSGTSSGGPSQLHPSQPSSQQQQQQHSDQQSSSRGSSSSGHSSGRSSPATYDPLHHLTFAEQCAADRAEIAAGLDANLLAALRVALLLSPPVATFRDVARRVAGLSYEGDVRMGLAEDSRKVERIVAGSWAGFCDLYLPLLRDASLWRAPGDSGGGALLSFEEEGAAAGSSGGGGGGYAVAAQATVRQDASLDARAAAIAELPAALLMRMASRVGVRRPWAAAAAFQVPPPGATPAAPSAWPRSELATAAASWRRDVAWAAVKSGRHEALLHAGLRGIIRASSARQAAVGVLSAGVVKSVRYLGAKLSKAWRPR